ncbi:hypothetical protein F4780DRAFT_299878 [Xylariomycetidae sp. FL0641]|nr:hypothetical protein F4780DRAFT_299878 [Xylariomycetidae sp. FL0641]
MNAHALLTSQGWRGTGHSLHPTDDNNGLKHHLLINRNDDGRGLGSKKDHKVEAWWMNAFDQALKGIDTTSGTMKQTLKGGALEKITAKSAATKYTGSRGLYTSFVRGGLLQGTVDVGPQSALLTPPESGTETPTAEAQAKKEKKKSKESKEEKSARREARRLRKAEEEAQKEAAERAARKAEKKKRKAEEEAQKETAERAARKVEKKKAKKAERSAQKSPIPIPEEKGDMKEGETKEERRARRDARRKRKEEKRRLTASAR